METNDKSTKQHRARRGHLSDREARRGLALEASWEIDQTARLMIAGIPADLHERFVLLTMLRRVCRLASVQMSALSDDLDPVGDIEARFTETEGAT
jgi:hypothetical protein